MNTRRLYRSRSDKQLAGVAGGMAEYLELDPTLVRILWILSVFLGGFTILLYIILAFIMPLAPVGPVQGGPGGRGPSWAPGASWAPGGSPVPGTTPAAGTSGASVDEAGDAAGATADASPTQAWDAAQADWVDPAWTGDQGWTAQAPPPAPAPGEGERRRGPGAAIYAGILLVVFGAIALADSVIPGLDGVNLGPALVVALGAALLVGSMRRTTDESA